MDWKDFTLWVDPPLVQILKQQNHHGFPFVFSFNRSFYLKQRAVKMILKCLVCPMGLILFVLLYLVPQLKFYFKSNFTLSCLTWLWSYSSLFPCNQFMFQIFQVSTSNVTFKFDFYLHVFLITGLTNQLNGSLLNTARVWQFKARFWSRTKQRGFSKSILRGKKKKTKGNNVVLCGNVVVKLRHTIWNMIGS